MIGSRLLGAGQKRDLRRLTRILAALGALTGAGAGALLFGVREPLLRLFTRDAEAMAALRGPLWLVLCAAQLPNALVFVCVPIVAQHNILHGAASRRARLRVRRAAVPIL